MQQLNIKQHSKDLVSSAFDRGIESLKMSAHFSPFVIRSYNKKLLLDSYDMKREYDTDQVIKEALNDLSKIKEIPDCAVLVYEGYLKYSDEKDKKDSIIVELYQKGDTEAYKYGLPIKISGFSLFKNVRGIGDIVMIEKIPNIL